MYYGHDDQVVKAWLTMNLPDAPDMISTSCTGSIATTPDQDPAPTGIGVAGHVIVAEGSPRRRKPCPCSKLVSRCRTYVMRMAGAGQPHDKLSI